MIDERFRMDRETCAPVLRAARDLVVDIRELKKCFLLSFGGTV